MGLRVFAILAFLPAGLWAQVGGAPTSYFFPGGQQFDPAIVSPEAYLGYEIGSYHTRHDQIVGYFKELARLSDRAAYKEIGVTYGNRVMPILTVTDPENHRRLDEIRERHLAASRSGASMELDLDRPVIVHLGYGVHGNEASSSEAAMLTAYWLVASQLPEVRRFLRQGVVHVEPVLNPDGRDRHSLWVNMHRSAVLSADPLDREHNEVWPGGRSNHYWFDLNRDWFPLEHVESRARIDFLHSWMPNVVTDFHEMGTQSTYFFEPTKPISSWNLLIPERLYTEITADFAQDFAQALDEIGSFYFTREAFDNSYPGYGSTYPNFLGGLGLLFEQASSRGHIQKSDHQGVLTFAFTIRNQVRTSLATVRGAVGRRGVLFEYQQEFFASALSEADRHPVKAWVFGDAHDKSRNRAFLDLLIRHRVEVHELPETMNIGGHTFRPGSAWIVPTRQPHFRLVRSIFEPVLEFPDSVFYDASTWTLSLAYGLPHEAVQAANLLLGEGIVGLPEPDGLGTVPQGRYAYLLDWSDYSAPKALNYLLTNGLRAKVALEPFNAPTNEGPYSYPRGSISIPVQTQSIEPVRLHAIILEAERMAGLRFQSTDTGLALDGIDMGSNQFRALQQPRLLMVVGDGVSPYEAGEVWHLLDTKVGMSISKVDQRDFPRVRLSDYDVLVLVSGTYPFLHGDRLSEIRRWVELGGTLIALRTAALWAIQRGLTPNIDLPEADSDPSGGRPGRRDYGDARDFMGAQVIAGSIWQADVDITHPLGFGYQVRSLPVWRNHSLFLSPSRNPYSTVVQLTDRPHLSGYVSSDNEVRLRNSPSVMVDQLGRGTIVLILDNPNFRGYWYGTNRLFLNAIFFGRHISVPAVG